jgi:hypothetical protein
VRPERPRRRRAGHVIGGGMQARGSRRVVCGVAVGEVRVVRCPRDAVRAVKVAGGVHMRPTVQAAEPADMRPPHVRDARAAAAQIHVRREASRPANMRSKMRRADVWRCKVRNSTADMRPSTPDMRRSAAGPRRSKARAARQACGEDNCTNSTRERPCTHDTKSHD